MLVERPKIGQLGKRIQRELALRWLCKECSIVKQKSIAVAADRKWRIKQLGIREGLRHAVPERELGLLGLDHQNWNIGTGIQDVICPLGSTFSFRVLYAGCELASHHYSPICQADLLTKLMQRPSRSLDRGRDHLRADIPFCKRVLVHWLGRIAPTFFGQPRL